ncbi:hypothetical protein V1509DRAFT_623526 [Lipomyces kononenkoae]
MANARAIGRDVHIYLFSAPEEPLGGMLLSPSVTKKGFLFMLDILIIATGPYRVTLRSTGDDIMQTEDVLTPGDYDLRPYSSSRNISFLIIIVCDST